MGRPKQLAEGICPNPDCRKSGSPFEKYVPRNDSKDLYFYLFFRHNDGSKPCNLSNVLKKYKARQKILVEYNNKSNEATDFHYYPRNIHKILRRHPIKEVHINKTYPVIVYFLGSYQAQGPRLSELCPDCDNKLSYIHDLRCGICNNLTIMWCPKCQRHWDYSNIIPVSKLYVDRYALKNELDKLDVQTVELKHVSTFLETSRIISKGARKFLRELIKMHSKRGVIVTYGDDAISNADRISESFNCESIRLIDKYGILEKMKKKIDKKNKLEKSCKDSYNEPPRTLADPVDDLTE